MIRLLAWAPGLLLLTLLILLGLGWAVWPVMFFWALCFCVVAGITQGALCLSRALTRRPCLGNALWTLFYLCIGVSLLTAGASKRPANFDAEPWKAHMSPDTEERLALFTQVFRGEVPPHLAELPQEGSLRPALAVFAMQQKNHEVLEKLLSTGLSAQALFEGVPLLSEAVLADDEDSIRLLLAAGASVDQFDIMGDSPLILAAIAGDIKIIKILLAAGASPTRCNPMGVSAIDYARNDQVRALLQGEARQD